MQTFPLIGNYGIIPEDFEGECRARGYVVREACEAPSNFRCQMTLDAFLKERGVPAIMGVDTREITRILREEGVMNALICDAVPSDLSDLRAYAIHGAVAVASVRERQEAPCENARFRVALLDYGAKHNIVRELNKRGLPREHFAARHGGGGRAFRRLRRRDALQRPRRPRRERL